MSTNQRSPKRKTSSSRRAERTRRFEFGPESVRNELLKAAVPLDKGELARRLQLTAAATANFDNVLALLEREGRIIRNRRGAICLVERAHLIKGRVQGHADGFGFLVRDDRETDCFIGSRQMQKVLHGDRVIAREVGVDRRGRSEVAIVEVLERANLSIVGRLRNDHGILTVEPEDKRISQPLLVAAQDAGGAQPGQVVVAQILAQPSGHAQPVARVLEVLGSYADPGMEIEIALRKHGLPYLFSPEAQAEAGRWAVEPRAKDLHGRSDLRSLPLVTIDGESARDFDDAVYCEPLVPSDAVGARRVRSSGFRLVVAIADVSHYVQHGGPLDAEAQLRGNSVYFPRRVIPMLPEVLSNGLCSLNPDGDRLCVVCDMRIGARGRIERYEFYCAVMRSRARLTYTQVAAFLAGDRAEISIEVARNLDQLGLIYNALAQARERRGAIDFETIETELVFDNDRKIVRIVKVERNFAHRLIEECMLAANVCASAYLRRHRHPMLYRVHEGPTPEKLESLREFLAEFGMQLEGGDDPKAADYARLLTQIKERPDAQLLQTVLLRSLQQAVYSPENSGHFGLAYESYTHFTSPIRRYPDLLVHRAIKAVLARSRYSPDDWAALGSHCSQTERRADDATRDVVSWLKCYYMRDRVGERFEGSISAVTGFGVFVALDAVYVEGLVHISELGSDYFNFDPVRHQLLGSRTGRRFRLGDRLAVKLVRVDLDRMRIDFVLDE
jgi:ribonuclease R